MTSALALWFSLIWYCVWIVLSQFQNLAGPTYRDALFKHYPFICCYGQLKVIYLMSDFWSTCPTLPKHILAQAYIFQLVVHSRNHAFPRHKGTFSTKRVISEFKSLFSNWTNSVPPLNLNKFSEYGINCTHTLLKCM